MNRKTAIAFLLLVFPSLVFAQVKQRNIRLEVLKHNRIGREYIFKEEDQSTTHLTYLGSLRTKKGVRYKIIRGVLDTLGVAKHMQARSRYGAKRPK